MKTTNFFSKPLMKRNIRTNLVLSIVIVVIMCMMSTVVNFAMSMMSAPTTNDNITDAQKDFYSYLTVLAAADQMTGSNLSYNDFISTDDKSVYDAVFKMMSQNQAFSKIEVNLSSDGFQDAIDRLSQSEVDMETYVSQFEYVYALNQSKGIFSGESLDVSEMLSTMLETMGVSPELVENMSKMDTTTMLNQMYFTVIGLLPIFIWIVIVANGLVANQVDSGSLAYVLSTPIKRKAVVITQSVFMIVAPLIIIGIVCLSRIASTAIIYDEVCVSRIVMLYLGMYVLVEAVSGICYLGSCVFNLSRQSMAFGGGFTVWFFLASLLGMFGSDSLVNTGMGVEQLGIFNKLTLIGLYDIENLSTIGTGAVCYDFAWKLVVLAITAVACYVVGSVRFCKKDLPL